MSIRACLPVSDYSPHAYSVLSWSSQLLPARFRLLYFSQFMSLLLDCSLRVLSCQFPSDKSLPFNSSHQLYFDKSSHIDTFLTVLFSSFQFFMSAPADSAIRLRSLHLFCLLRLIKAVSAYPPAR